jgi:hypothetical protein
MYKNCESAWSNSGMHYKCKKHNHFIAECPEVDELKGDYKHHPRTKDKYCSRNIYHSKQKNEGQGRAVATTRRRLKLWWLVRATSTLVPATSQAQAATRKMVARAIYLGWSNRHISQWLA